MKNLLGVVLATFAILLLGGCTQAINNTFFTQPRFNVVVDNGDKFQDKNTTISTFENRLTNDVGNGGGKYVDNKGFYVNFTADVDTGLLFTNVMSKEDTSVYNDFYFYSPMQQIIFLVNNKDRIDIKLKHGDVSMGEVQYSKYSGAYTEYSEYATGNISTMDFVKLMNAETIDVKIIGAKRTRTIENAVIQTDFKEHLRQFYDAVIANTQKTK